MDMFQWRKLAIRCLYMSMLLIVIAIVSFKFKFISISTVIMGSILFVVYVVISFKHWRCPNCKEQFPVVYSRMDERTVCWHCLAKLK